MYNTRSHNKIQIYTIGTNRKLKQKIGKKSRPRETGHLCTLKRHRHGPAADAGRRCTCARVLEAAGVGSTCRSGKVCFSNMVVIPLAFLNIHC